jgi:pyridoxal phosphate enzyme (YggS family)
MTCIRPFAAIRATRDKVHLVASRSYVSYSVKDLRDKLRGNPFTYLHIIHPDLGAKTVHKTSGEARVRLVRERYEQFRDEGVFIREQKPCYYIYRQIKKDHAFVGVMATVSVQDYLDGNIRIHEHTLSSRETTFTQYLDITALNAEPVLLFHERHEGVAELLVRYQQTRPEYDFSTTNRVQHQLWVVEDETDIAAITGWYDAIPHLYIADGHHRCASSAALYQKWKAEGRITSGDHPANYFMAFMVAESDMKIYEFNRLVRDMGSLTQKKLMSHLRFHFHVRLSDKPAAPSRKGEFGMYFSGDWYELELIRPADKLDADVLYEKVLQPLFGIGDQKKDDRIAYMEGPRGLDALMREVDKGRYVIGFSMCPVDVKELREVSDGGNCMPPKSTWIEPKLRSGLLIHELHTPVQQALLNFRRHVPSHVTLIAVSKKKSVAEIMEAYLAGQRDFGENYVQELVEKQPLLPPDIRWHFIGHLQSNKVKYIAPFVHMIHSVDSYSLLTEIDRQAKKHNRRIPCLIQVHIAEEDSKFGVPLAGAFEFERDLHPLLPVNAPVSGLMGMATFTDDTEKIRNEFRQLRRVFQQISSRRSYEPPTILSMGMTSDWKIAVEEGSNMIRIGSAIFGSR